MRYQSYESPLTLFDIVGSIFRYKWRVMLVTLLMLVVSGTAIFLFPKKYESEAKIFVRLGRGSANLDPAAIGQTISIQESRETEMNSMTDMLESRSLAESIVADIGVERLLKKYAWIEVKFEELSDLAIEKFEEQFGNLAQEPPAAEGALDEDAIDQLKRQELAIKEVQGNLRIDSPKKSTTIGVAFRARDPELAKDVVESVIENYKAMHIAAYQSMGTLEFFDQQFAEQAALVAQSEDELRQAKNENSIVTMKGEQESLQSEITDVKKMALQTLAEREASLAKVRELEADMNDLEPEIVSQKTSGIASNATDAMRDRLYALEIEEKDLTSKYAETDPRVLRVREQLRTARAIVEAEPHEVPQSVMAVNPVRQQVHNELLIAKSGLAALDAKSQALEKLESELIERLNRVNNLEVVSDEMQREIEIARDNHRSYAKKLEESRVNAALDEQALSNVSVVGAPTARYKHVSPKRSLLAVLGGILSLMCGVMVALASDYRRNAKEIATIRQAEKDAYLRHLQFAHESFDPPQALEEMQLAQRRRLLQPATSGSATPADREQVLPSGELDDAESDDVSVDAPKKAK